MNFKSFFALLLILAFSLFIHTMCQNVEIGQQANNCNGGVNNQNAGNVTFGGGGSGTGTQIGQQANNCNAAAGSGQSEQNIGIELPPAGPETVVDAPPPNQERPAPEQPAAGGGVKIGQSATNSGGGDNTQTAGDITFKEPLK